MTRTRPALALLSVSLFTLSSCNDAANLLTPDMPQGSTVAPMCFGRAATIYPGNPGFGTITDDGSGNLTITGGPGKNVIVGGSGNDIIHGLGDDDRICGGDGNDVISGSDGRDQIDGEGGIDEVDYSASAARVIVDLSNATREEGGDAQGDLLANVENVKGSAFNDILSGDASANVLDGGNGSDKLYGNDENDTLNGGSGADQLVGGNGSDIMNGDAGNDLLVPGAGADNLDGGADTDEVSYHTSSIGVTVDLAAGTGSGSGSDAEGDAISNIENVTGSELDDVIDGSSGANVLDGASGNDVLNGAGGNDTLYGRTGEDELHGGADNDLLIGLQDDDELYGDAGNDDLRAGEGTNIVDGGADTDSMISRSCLDTVSNVESYTTLCAADATQSTITPAASQITADGGTSVTTITVQLKDASGTNLTIGGKTVVLTTDKGTLTDGTTTATSLTALDQDDGTYTLTLNSSNTLETATITGTVDAVAITDDASVQFIAGPVDHFVVTGTDGNPIPQQASGTPFNVRIVAQDAQNHTANTYTGTVSLTANPGAIALGTTAAFTAGVFASQSVTISSGNDFTITASNGTQNGTSASFTVTANPSAVANEVAGGSAPNDSYHGSVNAALSVVDGSLDLLSNDNLGYPAAAVTHFGAVQCNNGSGSLIAATTLVTATAVGNTQNLNGAGGCTGGTLLVNADGTLTFTPTATYTGLFRFQYRIGNGTATSDAQVTLAIGVRPTAANSTYGTNVLGNVPINTATSTNTLVTATGDVPVFNVTATTGGAAVVATAKTYTFTPSAGFSGAASFTFTVTNGFGTSSAATVGLTVAAPVWFIDRNAVAAGDGRLATPFQDLSTAYAAATKPQANQSVFLYSSGTNYNSGVTLLAGQKLIGQGATGASFAAVTGVTWPADAGTQPSVGGTNPSLISGLTLGSGNTLQGFNLTGASTLSGTNFGTLTVSQVGINTTAQALNLNTGTISGSFGTVTSTGGTNAVSLTSVNSSAAVTLTGPFSGATGSTLNINGGNIPLTITGNVTQANNAALLSVSNAHTGTLTFNTGTLSMPHGTGLQFDNADGTYNFNGTNTFSNSTAGGNAGIDILNGSGGTFSFGATTSITNPTGPALFVDASAPTLTVNGSISTNVSSGRPVHIEDLTGGSITIGASVNSTGQGILVQNNTTGTPTISFTGTRTLATAANNGITLDNNDVATINFGTAAMSITTSTGEGFRAVNGGAVNVTGVSNDVATGTGVAVRISDTNVGGDGVRYRAVSSTGASNGIFLSNTGSTGGFFRVDGTGTVGSGGLIQNTVGADGTTSGNGVYLNNTRNIVLTSMIINNHPNFGILGTTVHGFTLDNSRVAGANGTDIGSDESSISMTGLSGVSTFSNDSISGGVEDNIRILNHGIVMAATDSILFNNVRMGHMNSTTGNTSLLVRVADGSNNKVRIVNSVFHGARGGSMFHLNVVNTATANLKLTGNTFNNTMSQISGAGGVLVTASGTAASVPTLTFDIQNNSFRGSRTVALNINKDVGQSVINGNVSNNTIGVAGVANSGSVDASGIQLRAQGGGTYRATVVNNTIRQYNNFGIILEMGDAVAGGGHGRMDITMTSNNLPEPGTNPAAFPINGLHVNIGTVENDAHVLCLNATSNTLNTSGTSSDIRVRQRNKTTIYLPGYTGGSSDNTAAGNYVKANNFNQADLTYAFSNSVGVGAPLGPGNGFQNQSCNAPTL